MRIKRNVIARSLTSVVVTVVALSQSAVAGSGTWTNGASGSWSASTNWLGCTIADGSGYTADFSTIDITNDTTVTVDTPRTIGNLTFGDADTNSAASWTVDRSAANTLTLANGTITVNPLGMGKSVTLSLPLAATTQVIAFRGGGNIAFTAENTMDCHISIGAADDNNHVTFSHAGRAVPDSWKTFTVGDNRSGNRMTVAGGCLATWISGGTVGNGSGGNSNSLIVTGAGSQVTIHANGGSQFNMGVNGAKSNHLEVSAGGFLKTQKFAIGRAGGTDNSALITGAGSRVGFGQLSQCCVNVGTDVGGTARNSITIENGGALLYESSEYKSGGSIGDSNGADNNFILVKANSTFEFRHTTSNSLPFVLGAYNGRDGNNYQGFPIDSTASGNHLDIVGGGTFVTENASVYLMGVKSALNLGDGDGISRATVGATAANYGGNSYSPGIVLYKADSRLNFNSGRLTAAAPGEMVSGAGVVSNAGPAFVSTDYTNTIDSVIIGPGSLTKEGAGTLTLTATNSYDGDTIVSAGVLGLDVPSLSDEADVYLVTGAQMDLNFGGTDVIRQLYVNGVLQGGGKYGAGERLESFFVADGPGILQVPGLVGSALIVR